MPLLLSIFGHYHSQFYHERYSQLINICRITFPIFKLLLSWTFTNVWIIC